MDPCTVDQFASYYNTQLPRFNSRCWNPGAEAVDACTYDRYLEINWWYPLVFLIPRVFNMHNIVNVRGYITYTSGITLAVSLLWPLICPIDKSFAPFMCDTCDLPLSKHLFLNGRDSTAFLVVPCLLVAY